MKKPLILPEFNNEDEDKDADEPVVKTHMSGLKQQRVAHYCL